MPRAGSALGQDADKRRAAYRSFDRSMSDLISLYTERAAISPGQRSALDQEIARTEDEVRAAWRSLAETTGEPLATHF